MSKEEDFCIEWSDKNGYISDVRVTKGKNVYKLSWWRKIMMFFTGKSHWKNITIRSGLDK